jgi:hypothetical protein
MSYEHECPHGSLSIFTHTNYLLASNNFSEFFSVVFIFLREADVPTDLQNFLTFLDIPNGAFQSKHE